ncbi:MAG: DNA recombination protein RmuC [Betaproteobacteria bacterium]|nr:DNA recombination protein RmuC [Betaproteobacteria bacterium]NBP35181.1 DNA recombination protein RmuC [Betaproteobacteria bacterium]NBP37513.1 DNA recombination protein RmuC [Betaproteobacteria bacterium]NBQ77549.1 DNA recombination protein RmuC [Betaproteobacteria bacterium]NBQ95914.1 DNA recombination protein RmuC [Betaproteobacteria bacterium]
MFAELGLVFMLTIGVALGGLGGYWVRSLIARSEQQALRAQLESETQATQKVQLEREQSLEQHSRWLHDQIKLLAAQMLDERTKQFTVQSEQQLGRLIEPLKDRIVEFRAKLDDVQLKDVERAAQLQAELNQLKSLNQQMTQEAHKLSTALQGQSKVQGHWGELVLSNLLERSGLRDGTDFRREVSFQTDSGRKRPDAIVFLPQGKHIVIDAKVSLNAYTRYVNALDNHERSVALQEHLRAINDRVQELSSRSYAELPGLNTPEIVFMFIPIESAFGEAMRGDSTLFQKAMDQQVVITTPTTLLTSLQIVRQLWRFEDQHKHSAELAERAAKIYKKLVAFVSTMEAIDQSLSKARDSYDKAVSQLVTGKANLIQQAKEFERLGVAVHSSLPEALVARAELELEPSTNLTKDLAD